MSPLLLVAALKVLAVGNSFSVQMARELPPIVGAMGEKVDICCMYIGGCSFARHMENLRASEGGSDEKQYELRWGSTDGSWKGVPERGNLPGMLRFADWDRVVIHCASRQTPFLDQWSPDGDELVAAIRRYLPKADILVQETWATCLLDSRHTDQRDRTKPGSWGFDRDTAAERISANYAAFAKRHGLGLIPVGTAVERFRREHPLGVDVCGRILATAEDGIADTAHLNPVGTYLQACVWALGFFPEVKGFGPEPFVPETVPAREADWCRATALACRDAKTPSAALPVLRVAVMSDHQGYAYAEDAGARNLEKALDWFAPLKPDAVVAAGDICDSCENCDFVRWYRRRCDERLGKLPHVACMGNHEICYATPEIRAKRTPAVVLADFNSVFGYADGQLHHEVIGGYDFIAFSFLSAKGYTDEEMALLKTALDRAVARDAKKPVFVVTHYHPRGTVACDASYMNGKLRALLNGYPQVVSLSGDTHEPLSNPASIWQGEFTAVNTSTLCYACETPKAYPQNIAAPAMNELAGCLIPYGHEGVGCLFLEIYEDRLVVRRRLVRQNRELPVWEFPLPYDPAKAKYSPGKQTAAAVTPEFPSDPEPTLWYDFGYVYLQFAAATDTDAVYGYEVEIGGKRYFHLSDFYRVPAQRLRRVTFRCPPGSVKAGESYRCRVTPVGFFGRRGSSFEWMFSVKSGYPCRNDRMIAVPE